MSTSIADSNHGILSTMPSSGLSLSKLLCYGREVFGDSAVFVGGPHGTESTSFDDIGAECGRLANALEELGVKAGDRVATMCANHLAHLEAYLAVPAMGAVLHTVNIRLADDDLVFILNSGGARVLLIDEDYWEFVARQRRNLVHIREVVVYGRAESVADHSYSSIVAQAPETFQWKVVSEDSAAMLCYTSGTTGRPKGVVYSHRSVLLHTYAVCSGNAYALNHNDRVLLVVPMFHANGWGLAHGAWMAGADIVLTGRDVSPASLSSLIMATRPTVSAGVPTVWSDLLEYGKAEPLDLTSLRLIVGGGSSTPESLMERYHRDYSVRMVQGWGMTETSPLVSIGSRTSEGVEDVERARRRTAGRLLPGVEMRLVDDADCARLDDGPGHIELRGLWITTGYLATPSGDSFHDGWLRTGDIGHIDSNGFVSITDRSKDLIKSGGEWISSVDLEEALREVPGIRDASVVGIRHERWQERPVAWIIPSEPNLRPDATQLYEHLIERVAKWWIPDLWIVTNSLPRTGVGKIDKSLLRSEAQRLQASSTERVVSYEF